MLFVSHATADDRDVTALVARLNAAGVETWVDHLSGIIAGDGWNQAIQSALNTCDAGLFVLSPRSARRPECEAEWRRILADGKRLYVLLLEDVPPRDFPYRLGIIHYVKHTDAGIDALIAAITGKAPLAVAPIDAVATGRRLTHNDDDRWTTYAIEMIGRDADLKKALTLLGEHVVCIEGVGGLGKSRLAYEIAQTGGHPGVAWLRLNEVSTSDDLLALLRNHLNLTPDTAERAVIAETPPGTLVVLDNAESVAADRRDGFARLVNALRERDAAVLLTTREGWHEIKRYRGVAPTAIQPEDGARVVEAMIDALDVEAPADLDAAALARAARYHPRLIEVAVGMLDYTPKAEVIAIMARLSHEAEEALNEMIGITLDAMDREDGGKARALLRRLSVFAGAFDMEAVRAIADDKTDDASLRASLKMLVRYRFVRFSDDRYSIDDLVKAAATVDEGARRPHYDHYKALARRLGGDQTDAGRYVKMEPYADEFAAAFAWALDADADAAYWLANACQDFLANRGR